VVPEEPPPPPPFVPVTPAEEPGYTPWAPGGYDDMVISEDPVMPFGEGPELVASLPDRPERLAGPGRIERPRNGTGGQARFRANEAPAPASAEEWSRSDTSPGVTRALPGVIGQLPDTLATGPDGEELTAGMIMERGLGPNRRGPVVASGLLAAAGWIAHFVIAWKRRPRYDPA
jgi:hypothetical protein